MNSNTREHAKGNDPASHSGIVEALNGPLNIPKQPFYPSEERTDSLHAAAMARYVPQEEHARPKDSSTPPEGYVPLFFGEAGNTETTKQLRFSQEDGRTDPSNFLIRLDENAHLSRKNVITPSNEPPDGSAESNSTKTDGGTEEENPAQEYIPMTFMVPKDALQDILRSEGITIPISDEAGNHRSTKVFFPTETSEASAATTATPLWQTYLSPPSTTDHSVAENKEQDNEQIAVSPSSETRPARDASDNAQAESPPLSIKIINRGDEIRPAQDDASDNAQAESPPLSIKIIDQDDKTNEDIESSEEGAILLFLKELSSLTQDAAEERRAQNTHSEPRIEEGPLSSQGPTLYIYNMMEQPGDAPYNSAPQHTHDSASYDSASSGDYIQ